MTQSAAPYLQLRTVEFSRGILQLCKRVSQTVITRPLINQLVKSSTSIGANYAESQYAISRSDFRNKIFIAKKEAGETVYWLELLSEVIDDEKLSELKQEATYILMTLQKITKTLHSSPEN